MDQPILKKNKASKNEGKFSLVVMKRELEEQKAGNDFR